MSMRTCPECGSSVKLENMKRHFANVHPGKDPAAAITEEEHREIQKESRSGRSPVYARAWFKVAVVVVGLLGVGYFGLPYILGTNSGGVNIVTYCGGEATAQHYHTLLVVYSNGAQEVVPADIGISPSETASQYACPSGALHMLHTHDSSGIIHNELPGGLTRSPTLGDFFAIWGQPLSHGVAWQFSGTVTATEYFMGSGQHLDYSSNPGTIPLSSPPGGQDAYPIPQYLIFGGQGGNTGQSGGVFSGEIIFLNVTA